MKPDRADKLTSRVIVPLCPGHSLLADLFGSVLVDRPELSRQREHAVTPAWSGRQARSGGDAPNTPASTKVPSR